MCPRPNDEQPKCPNCKALESELRMVRTRLVAAERAIRMMRREAAQHPDEPAADLVDRLRDEGLL